MFGQGEHDIQPFFLLYPGHEYDPQGIPAGPCQGRHIIVYPEIIEQSGSQTGQEGCLSVPGKAGMVTRPNHVVVRAYDENMEQFESATENEKTVSNTETEKVKNQKKPSMAKNILWIIAAIIISLIVGAVITFIKKKRQTNKFDNDYFDDDDSDADYSDNDSIVEYEESAEESDITESTSEIQSNSDDLEEYLDD